MRLASYVPGELIPLPLSGSIPELPHVAKVENRTASKISRKMISRHPCRCKARRADTKLRGRFSGKRCGPSRLCARSASAGLENFVRQPQKTFATWGNSGIEPDKGKGISSPGTYEAGLMWPRNDGERQWSTMSDWTCR